MWQSHDSVSAGWHDYYQTLILTTHSIQKGFEAKDTPKTTKYEGWNFKSGNYLFTTDTK